MKAANILETSATAPCPINRLSGQRPSLDQQERVNPALDQDDALSMSRMRKLRH